MEIEGYEILHQIGEGSVGTVHKARQKSLDRTVAIKVLKPEAAGNAEDVEAFIKEARSAAALKHSNIVHVYDVSTEGDRPYVVMEYVHGPTVGALLRQGPISPKTAMETAYATAKALDHAWQRARLIHRDIKPDNIIIDDDGTVKLADLGLAKQLKYTLASDGDRAEHLVGTPNYISPEQAAGGRSDCRSDMYSLGASLYHMVTGTLPFESSDPLTTARQHITDQLPNPRTAVPTISIGLTQFITKLMMKNPEDRFTDWEHVLTHMKKLLSGHIVLKPGSPDAISTIASPRQASTGARARTKTAPRQTERRSEVAPAWMRAAVLIPLFAFWAWVVYQRLLLPPMIPVPELTNTHARQIGAPIETVNNEIP